MTGIPARRGLRMEKDRFIATLSIKERTRVEGGRCARGCAQQAVVVRRLLIGSLSVRLRQFDPLNAAGSADLDPACLARATQGRPRRQRCLQQQQSNQATGRQAKEGAANKHGPNFIIQQPRPGRIALAKKPGAIEKNCCLKKQPACRRTEEMPRKPLEERQPVSSVSEEMSYWQPKCLLLH